MTMTLFLFGCAWAAAAEVDSQANLTSEERSWLTNNPEKPALQNNVESPPSEFSAAPGTFIGMGAEVAAQAEHEPGVGFVKRPSDDWNAYWAALFMMLLLAGLLCVSVVLKRRLNQKVADLRESEDKFRTLFQKHAAVKLLIDPDTGGIIDANEMAEKFYGWSVEQLRRMRIQDINTLPPEQVKAEMAKAQGQQRFCFQFRHRRADGSIRDVEVFSNAIDIHGKALLHSIILDITERKRAEEALRESEERYRSFIRHSSEGIYRNDVLPPVSITLPERDFVEAVNRQAIVAEVNEALARMYGLRPEDMIGRLATDFAPDFGVRAALVVRSGDYHVNNLETRDKDKNGQTIYLMENYHGEVVHGHLVRIWGTQVDITERKREHESLLRTQFAMDRASDSILWVDEDGRLVYVNDAACATLGYAREELLQMKVFDIDPDFPAAQWEQHKQEMRRTGSMLFESRHRTKDGRLFPVEVRTNYFDFDGHFLSCAFDRDITERKRAEAALEKRIMALSQPLDDPGGLALEDLFNLDDLQRLQDEFAQATGVASIITHPEGTPITKPSNFTRFCADIIRKTETGLADCLHSDALVARSTRDGFANQLCLGAGLWNSGAIISVGGRHIANWIIGQVRDETQTEEQMRAYARKIGVDEKTFIEAYREVPVMPQEQFGRVAQVLSTLASQLSASAYQNVQQARFITERKRAEAEREKLTDQLTQAQKMESVGRLAGGVAHDFNNMLGVIIGHTELALEQVDPVQPLHDSLLEIKKAAERSASLTRQLLAFARKQTVAPKVLDLNDTVQGMLNMLQRLIGEHIDLVWRPGKDLSPVKVDPSQIDQILANLCVNARDAIGDTGKVTIETDAVVFDAGYCEEHPGFVPGEYVLLAVSDNGGGMDKDTLNKLFEPFFTTKVMGKGTGLGLSTVYGIVKQNNGFINVYSEPGHGTTFKIYLPQYLGKTARAPRGGATLSAVRGQETILLVEDEPGILKMTRTMLERQGYTVLAASTPSEAIRLAREYPNEIHLLVTDVVMPEMNGRDLAQKLITLYPNLKRLFMSGYTANVIAHHGVLDEGVHFIQKPFSMKDIAEKIRTALET